MKYFTLTAALISATAFASTVQAQDLPQILEDIEVTSTIDTVSEYVFRGVSLGGSSLQPGTEFSIGNFSIGTWYSAGFGASSDVQSDELDLYAGYSVPLDSSISIDLGATYYHYPQSGSFLSTEDGNSGSYEFSTSLGFAEAPFSPSATAYYDVTLETLTFEGNVVHSVDLPRDGWTADLGLTAGHVDFDGGDYQWGTASVALNKVITDDISYFVSGNFTLNSEDDTLGFDRDADRDTSLAFATRDSSTLFWLGTGLAVSY